MRAVTLGCAALSVAAPASGCGRTQLDEVEACRSTDTTRPCQDTCGIGTESCIDGTWHACVVPPTMRACSGICGDGVQRCVDRTWLACEIPVATRPCSSACGAGREVCMNETWGACDAPLPRPPTLHTVVRDFHATHPDFELPLVGDHLDPGIVAEVLGPDDKPVYAGDPTTPTTSGAASFHDWYNDVPGQNERTAVDLTLTASAAQPDLYVYDNQAFFPIDDMLFGDEGQPHNYDFTLEAHTHFTYRGGETFSFAGDDDLWAFINRRLAINLGGLHQTLGATVDLDASAAALGMSPGQTVQLDIFFVERHVTGSTFTVRTSIADASSCE
jgi:fibro-slime domain-containing protein